MSSKVSVTKNPKLKKLSKAIPKVTCTSVNKRSIKTISLFKDKRRYEDKATKVKQRRRIRVKNLTT